MRFPSPEWFNAVAAVFNADDRYRGAGGGQSFCRFGVIVGDDIVVVTMDGHECSGAESVDRRGLADVDFYLEMPRSKWMGMLKDIATNGRATLDHTLNTIDLDLDEGLSKSIHGDQYREDLFFRYNQTLQFLFDASARVQTDFGASS